MVNSLDAKELWKCFKYVEKVKKNCHKLEQFTLSIIMQWPNVEWYVYINKEARHSSLFDNGNIIKHVKFVTQQLIYYPSIESDLARFETVV